MRRELWVKVVKTYHAGACNSPVQLVLSDIHSEELNVIKVVAKQVNWV